MPDKTKSIAIVIMLVIVVVAAIFLGNKLSRPEAISTQTVTSTTDRGCPENYATDEERVAEAKSFITDFLASNPQGNITDYAQARIDFLTKNNCIQTLKYIQDNGGIEVYKKTIIDNLMATDTPATSTTTDSQYIPDTSSSFIKNYFDDASRLGIVSVSPKVGFNTGIAKYPTLTWQTEYISKEASLINIDVEYPRFTSGDTLTDFALNQYIESIIAGIIKDDQTRLGDQTKLKKLVALAPNDEFESSLDLSIRYRVLGVTNGIISLEMVATDFTGGGNGDHDYPYTINWDLKSNRLLNPSDIFCSSDYIHQLIPLVNKQLVSILPDYWQDGTSDKSDNWQHFLLHKDGVIAVFPPYQVSSGASGIVRVFISDSKSLNLLCLP